MQPSNRQKTLRCLAISDTHEDLGILHRIAEKEEGDVFIHGGDFTYYGEDKYFTEFSEILGKLKFRYKIVIAGNHEISLDDTYIDPEKKKLYLDEFPCKYTKEQLMAKFKEKGCIYLEHQAVNIEGVDFFGSPFTNYYCGSAFQYRRKYDDAIWSEIPSKVDVLITHSPPHGILDKNVKGVICGSVALEKYSKLRRPKYHIFGHIHEARGHAQINGTHYVNIALNGIRF